MKGLWPRSTLTPRRRSPGRRGRPVGTSPQPPNLYSLCPFRKSNNEKPQVDRMKKGEMFEKEKVVNGILKSESWSVCVCFDLNLKMTEGTLQAMKSLSCIRYGTDNIEIDYVLYHRFHQGLLF